MAGTVMVLNKHAGRIPWTAVNIMRGTVFGNPYRISSHATREDVINKYREYLLEHTNRRSGPLYEAIVKLVDRYRDGEDLYLECVCHPLECHGDIIAAVIDNLCLRGDTLKNEPG